MADNNSGFGLAPAPGEDNTNFPQGPEENKTNWTYTPKGNGYRANDNGYPLPDDATDRK